LLHDSHPYQSKFNLLLTNEGLCQPITGAPILRRGAIGKPAKNFAKSLTVCKVAAL
jgi:hypothetical protein